MAVGTAVALACDTFLTIAIYNRPVLVEGLLRWVLLGPCLLILRMAMREVLRAIQALVAAHVDRGGCRRNRINSCGAVLGHMRSAIG